MTLNDRGAIPYRPTLYSFSGARCVEVNKDRHTSGEKIVPGLQISPTYTDRA